MSATATRKPPVADEEARAQVIEAAASLKAAVEIVIRMAEATPAGQLHAIQLDLGREDDPFHAKLGETAAMRALAALARRMEDLLRPPGYQEEEGDAFETEPIRVEIAARAVEIEADLSEAVAWATQGALSALGLREEAKRVREAGRLYA